MEKDVAIKEWALSESLHYLELIISASSAKVVTLISGEITPENVIQIAKLIVDYINDK